MADAGAPWPGARYGEVTGPDEVRSYLLPTAAALAQISRRTLQKMIHDQEGLAVRAKISGQRGPAAWFLDADRFEALGSTAGWWPPSSTATALATGDVKAAGPVIRKRIEDLELRVSGLEAELDLTRRERDELLAAVETLTRMARRR